MGPAFGGPDDKLSDTHHVLASPCQRARMTDYRRNFIAGGSFLFTANLAERRWILRRAQPIPRAWVWLPII
jgi:hypothetical protein